MRNSPFTLVTGCFSDFTEFNFLMKNLYFYFSLMIESEIMSPNSPIKPTNIHKHPVLFKKGPNLNKGPIQTAKTSYPPHM